ncbi:MAG: hypothetical protein AMS18_03895 [Gemmatimonas sp. SG8_17]|nr:MAG: hypothetical protein AMS18_03895 [Gemmatimonas sp. SG8_17]
MNRPNPYEMTFGEAIETRFPSVRQEARLSRKDATDPAQFASLPTVQRILTDIESPSLLDERPAAAAEYLMLLYSAFRFWEGGKVVLQVDRDDWTEPAAVGAPELPEIPSGACYLQFPEHWFWAQIEETAPHEPLDGIFLARSAEGRQLVLVAVLGLRVERGGFSQVSLTVASVEAEEALAGATAPLFPPLMDGGSEAGFRSLGSAADLLLLAHLALVQITK